MTTDAQSALRRTMETYSKVRTLCLSSSDDAAAAATAAAAAAGDDAVDTDDDHEAQCRSLGAGHSGHR